MTALGPWGKSSEMEVRSLLGRCNESVSFCTGKVIIGESTMDVLSYVDTWKGWILPLFLAFEHFWGFLLSQLPRQSLVSSLT